MLDFLALNLEEFDREYVRYFPFPLFLIYWPASGEPLFLAYIFKSRARIPPGLLNVLSLGVVAGTLGNEGRWIENRFEKLLKIASKNNGKSAPKLC